MCSLCGEVEGDSPPQAPPTYRDQNGRRRPAYEDTGGHVGSFVFEGKEKKHNIYVSKDPLQEKKKYIEEVTKHYKILRKHKLGETVYAAAASELVSKSKLMLKQNPDHAIATLIAAARRAGYPLLLSDFAKTPEEYRRLKAAAKQLHVTFDCDPSIFVERFIEDFTYPKSKKLLIRKATIAAKIIQHIFHGSNPEEIAAEAVAASAKQRKEPLNEKAMMCAVNPNTNKPVNLQKLTILETPAKPLKTGSPKTKR